MDPATRPKLPVLIIEARYYEAIGEALIEGALAELDAQGVAYERVEVPGALEIPQVLGAAVATGAMPAGAAKSKYSGAILLGCVIRGETSHYDIVCNNANHWCYDIATRHGIPIGNAILTVDNEMQAMARARGGRAGKGADAARACLRLIEVASGFAGERKR
ncbi:MAG: 6,7-dimethyl-8-ribityllumazine synthase [Hyphomicrobiaceae bacterium]